MGMGAAGDCTSLPSPPIRHLPTSRLSVCPQQCDVPAVFLSRWLSVELISGRTETGLCEAGAPAGVSLGSLASEKDSAPLEGVFPFECLPSVGVQSGQIPLHQPLGQAHQFIGRWIGALLCGEHRAGDGRPGSTLRAQGEL